MARLRHDGRCRIHHASSSGTSSPQQRRIPTPVSWVGGTVLQQVLAVEVGALAVGRGGGVEDGELAGLVPSGQRRQGRVEGEEAVEVEEAVAGCEGEGAAGFLVSRVGVSGNG